MTFGVSRDDGIFEWAGTSLSSIFAQRVNVLRPSMWRMVFDIFRFNQFALDLLLSEDEIEEPGGRESFSKPPRQESIGEYLDREGYSDRFRDDYLIPMTAAVWSTTPNKCSLEFPAVTLVRFMWNHHLLTAVSARPKWMTIPGGANRYIEAILQGIPKGNIHTRTPVKSVKNTEHDQVLVQTSNSEETFDHVILATHGDQALDIIRSSSTKEEREILSNFQTSKNVAVLHSDLSVCSQS